MELQKRGLEHRGRKVQVNEGQPLMVEREKGGEDIKEEGKREEGRLERGRRWREAEGHSGRIGGWSAANRVGKHGRELTGQTMGIYR